MEDAHRSDRASESQNKLQRWTYCLSAGHHAASPFMQRRYSPQRSSDGEYPDRGAHQASTQRNPRNGVRLAPIVAVSGSHSGLGTIHSPKSVLRRGLPPVPDHSDSPGRGLTPLRVLF